VAHPGNAIDVIRTSWFRAAASSYLRCGVRHNQYLTVFIYKDDLENRPPHSCIDFDKHGSFLTPDGPATAEPKPGAQN
jgi:hypothetical protein